MPRTRQSALPVDAPRAESAAATPPLFQPVRSARAFEEIAMQIRQELADGRLKVGSRLPAERALALQFGVSRNTLREALRSLEHAGLIRLQKGASGGAFISQGSGNAIISSMLDLYHMGSLTPDQLTEARIWLESVLVREACARATPEDLQALRDNVAEAAQAAAEGDFNHRAAVNLDFHRILARMTGNPIMMIVMDGLLTVLAQFIQTIGEYENTFVLPSRRRFIKHLEEGDAEAAVAEMETSLKRLQRGYLSRVEQKKEQPPAPVRRRAPAAKKKAA
ncbi:FCD domain-containing protein [Ramlibacter sp. AN1015]|uniref:FadR/GntR family transcriptional regulator n=1 Tax=Ramlibacter sp. AN1015 TaxID=3133428 RepID=UPI0030C41CBB